MDTLVDYENINKSIKVYSNKESNSSKIDKI